MLLRFKLSGIKSDTWSYIRSTSKRNVSETALHHPKMLYFLPSKFLLPLTFIVITECTQTLQMQKLTWLRWFNIYKGNILPSFLPLFTMNSSCFRWLSVSICKKNYKLSSKHFLICIFCIEMASQGYGRPLEGIGWGLHFVNPNQLQPGAPTPKAAY